MLSCCYQGKVLDFKYTKQPVNDCYNFYIGDIFIGQIFKMRKHNWHAVSFHANARGAMGGFGSRYHASEYLLILNKFQRDPSKDDSTDEFVRKSQEILEKIKGI